MPHRVLQRVLRAPASRPAPSPSSSWLPSWSSPSCLLRALSSTPVRAAPPREAPPRHSSSSASNMVAMVNDRKNSALKGPRPVAQPGQAASSLMTRYMTKQQRGGLAAVEALRNAKISTDYLRQMPRRWNAGDVYSPHDLSPVEMQKWRKRSLRKNDIVDVLGIRPLDMYKEFTTSSGQIIHSAGTSLRPVNQRKIAKMIRRVQGMGIYPTIHDHPEMLRDNFFHS
ncbi:hypothetical protein E4U42_000759 [Claviceps africana]|uniref:Small ribosomal subunit protein bS18m n=1 Tax=Claviceps africana TaxID=83212 RepID=A0A8K0JAD3_9HYPO|nr:hypothetical protein E4U42_000759 [Claviceps africana]